MGLFFKMMNNSCRGRIQVELFAGMTGGLRRSFSRDMIPTSASKLGIGDGASVQLAGQLALSAGVVNTGSYMHNESGTEGVGNA